MNNKVASVGWFLLGFMWINTSIQWVAAVWFPNFMSKFWWYMPNQGTHSVDASSGLWVSAFFLTFGVFGVVSCYYSTLIWKDK